MPVFQLHDPLPDLAAAAADDDIPISGFDAPAKRPGLAPGDTATALITMQEKQGLTQWIVEFEVAALTDKEQATPPRMVHLYSSTGHEIDLGRNRVALDIRILGPVKDFRPVSDAEDVRKSRVRVLVNADLLAVGLHRAMAVDQQLAAADPKDRIISFDVKPFAPGVVERARRRAAAAGITEEDERALIGMIPAQKSFLRIIVHTPGLAEVFFKVLDVSWWSILRHGGKVEIAIDHGPDLVEEIPLGPWNISLPGTARAEPFFVSLDGHPALTYRLAALPPRPPLLTTAGVIGIAAQRPDGNGPELMVQLLSARCAPQARNE